MTYYDQIFFVIYEHFPEIEITTIYKYFTFAYLLNYCISISFALCFIPEIIDDPFLLWPIYISDNVLYLKFGPILLLDLFTLLSLIDFSLFLTLLSKWALYYWRYEWSSSSSTAISFLRSTLIFKSLYSRWLTKSQLIYLSDRSIFLCLICEIFLTLEFDSLICSFCFYYLFFFLY